MAWTADVVRETSAEGDPQSNGAAESSVKVVKRHIRSIKLALESASGVEVPADHLFTWLVRCATSMHRRFFWLVETARKHTKEVWSRRAVLPLGTVRCASVVDASAAFQPSSKPFRLHDVSKEGAWDRWMDCKDNTSNDNNLKKEMHKEGLQRNP